MAQQTATISKMETTQTEEAKLESALFTFSQEGNCVDGGIEILEVRCESSLGIDNDEGCFYVLKTEQWSIESLEELKEIITRVSKVINK